MSITRKEFEAFLQRFSKTENNVVDLRREMQSLREEMKAFNENVTRSNNILSKLSSCEDNTKVIQSNGSTEERQVLPFDQIHFPSTGSLGDDYNKHDDERIDRFLNQWLGPDGAVQQDEYADVSENKTEQLKYYRDILNTHGKTVCTMMVRQFDIDQVDWSDWSYTKVPKERRQAAWEQIRQFSVWSNIPTYRCINFWLEDVLLKKYYRRVTRPKKDETVTEDQVTSNQHEAVDVQQLDARQQIADNDDVELIDDPFGSLPLVQYQSDDDAGESSSHTPPTKRR
ncbi:hypothetical protein EDC96DRAFT_613099 [Choanephora cucurbitarum]|nr:hypothetical protein EDC96DRAFT_613099 [Choanephora cucurbitarum]